MSKTLAHGHVLSGNLLDFGPAAAPLMPETDSCEETRLLVERMQSRDIPTPLDTDWVLHRRHGLSVAKGSFGTFFAAHCGARALLKPAPGPIEDAGPPSLLIYRPKGQDIQVFRRTCLNIFIPQSLALLGSTLLHAACVRVGDGVVMFAGESGSGKSTLAAGFAARGFDVFSDDVIRIEPTGSSATAYRAYAGGHLRTGSFLLPHTTASTNSSAPKHWFDFASPRAGLQAAPVLAFYFLGRTRRGQVEIDALSPTSAVHMMLRSLFLDGFDRQQRSREALGRTARLARAMPVYSLNYRRDSRRFDALMDEILMHAKGVQVAR